MTPLSATVSWLWPGPDISPALWSMMDALLVLITRALTAAVVKPNLLGRGSKNTDFMVHIWLG